MKRTHVLLGAYAGASVGWLAHWPLIEVGISAGIAALTAPGPDIDQHKWWKRMDRWVPDEWLGWGGPLQHRGITHFWGIPLAVAILLHAAGPWAGGWVLWGVLIGWVSHLAGDWVFGMASPWDHRGPGIPVGLWFWHVGLGLDTGGKLETILRWGLTVAPAAMLVHAVSAI